MQPLYYIPIIVVFVFLIISLRNKKLAVIKNIKKRKMEDKIIMIELAKKFIDKECIIYAFDGNHTFTGTIKEVSNGAVLIEKNGEIEAINLDFVIRIKEFPKNKKGKKKSIVF